MTRHISLDLRWVTRLAAVIVALCLVAAMGACTVEDDTAASASASDTAVGDEPANSSDGNASTSGEPTYVDEDTAGWEQFCDAMRGVRFDSSPSGDELDQLEMTVTAAAATAPEEISEATELFAAAFHAAINQARLDGGVLTNDHLYVVFDGDPGDAVLYVFDVATQHCALPELDQPGT